MSRDRFSGSVRGKIILGFAGLLAVNGGSSRNARAQLMRRPDLQVRTTPVQSGSQTYVPLTHIHVPSSDPTTTRQNPTEFVRPIESGTPGTVPVLLPSSEILGPFTQWPSSQMVGGVCPSGSACDPTTGWIYQQSAPISVPGPASLGPVPTYSCCTIVSAPAVSSPSAGGTPTYPSISHGYTVDKKNPDLLVRYKFAGTMRSGGAFEVQGVEGGDFFRIDWSSAQGFGVKRINVDIKVMVSRDTPFEFKHDKFKYPVLLHDDDNTYVIDKADMDEFGRELIESINNRYSGFDGHHPINLANPSVEMTITPVVDPAALAVRPVKLQGTLKLKFQPL